MLASLSFLKKTTAIVLSTKGNKCIAFFGYNAEFQYHVPHCLCACSGFTRGSIS